MLVFEENIISKISLLHMNNKKNNQNGVQLNIKEMTAHSTMS